jgi:hypothetical protein
MKMICIVKVGVGKSSDHFVKYHTSNLLDFVNFLDKDYPTWRWFNVYNTKDNIQIANYTKNKRPTTKTP